MTCLILLLTIGFVNAVCPPAEVVSPCTCLSDVITCAGRERIDIKSTMKKISTNRKRLEKHFKRLFILNDQITEIEANTTSDLTFDQIRIDAKNVQRIHSDALFGTADKVNFLWVSSTLTNYSSADYPYNAFDFLNKFINAENIYFAPPRVTHISSNAFKSLARMSNYLSFGYASKIGARLTISDNAFYQLYRVKDIRLDQNNINYIPKQAFRFFGQTFPLVIYLNSNDLNSSGLSNGWLANINRPIKITLAHNKITYLERDVLFPFLNKANTINLAHNFLNCSDCRNYWLAKGKLSYSDKVLNAYCWGIDKGPTIFDGDYEHCK